MKKIGLSVVYFLVCIQVLGQNTEVIQQIKTAMVFEKKPSIISIPIDISIEDLQKQINLGLPDLIYEDNSFSDNNNDGLKVKVWRKGSLIFTENKDGILTYEVPLKVWAQKEITVLGISQAPSTDFELKVKFQSKFKINDDYQIETKTKGLSYTWITKPVLKSGFIDIPIGPVIGKVITSNFPLFSEQIDKAIKEGFSLKSYVIEAWNIAKRPIQVSEEYNTWLRAEPIEVYQTSLKSVGASLKGIFGIKIYVETFVGTPQYVNTTVVDIPKLKTVISIPEEFEVQLVNVVSYAEANTIAQRMFIGEKFEFSNGRYSIIVNDLKITNKDEFLVFDIKTNGSFKGNIIVKGVPEYVEEKGMVMLKNVHLDIKTRNFLHKAAAWILEGTLEKRIGKEFGLPVNEILEHSKTSVNETINSEFTKGVKMKGQIIAIKPDKVIVTDEGILALVISKAKVQLLVKGM